MHTTIAEEHRVALGQTGDLPCVVDALQNRSDVRVELQPVGQLLDSLQAGRVDAALLPAGLLTDSAEELELLTSGCLACHGQGRCVVVATRGGPPEGVRRVGAEDPGRTGSLLASLVWVTEFETGLKFVSPDEPNDAVLLTGGEAKLPPGCVRPVNVGRLWFELTGLPLVLYCWAVSAGAGSGKLSRALAEVTAEVLGRQGRGCSGAGCLEPLSPEHLEGLEEFFHRCRELELIRTVPRLSVARLSGA